MPNIGSEIISSYLAGVRLRQEREQNEKQNQLRQQALQQQADEFEKQIALREKQFNAEQQMERSKFELMKTQAVPALSEAITKGLIPSEQIPNPDETNAAAYRDAVRSGQWNEATQLQPYLLRSTMLKNIFGNELTAQTPEAMAARQRTLMEPVTDEKIRQSVMSFLGTVPSRLKLEEAKAENAKEIQKMRDTAAMLRTEATNKNRLEAAKIAGRFKVLAANIAKQHDVDTDDVLSAAEMMKAGLVEASTIPVKIRSSALTLLHEEGSVPISPTVIKDTAKSVSQAANIIQEMEEVATRWKDKFGGITNKVSAAIQSKLDVNQFGNDLNRLQAQLGNLTSSFGGESGARLSDADREYMKKLGLNPGLTYKENLQNIKEMKNIVRRTLRTKLGYLSPSQYDAVMKGLNVSWLNEGTKKTQLKLTFENGKTELVDDTPENRKKYGVK